MTRLQRIIARKERLVVGLMSGTSADAVDAVLVKVRGSGLSTTFRTLAFHRYEYPKGYRAFVLEQSQTGGGNVGTISTLNILSAQLFAEAVTALLTRAGVPASRVDLIGSHGQTVHHLPEAQRLFGRSVRSTLQLGDPSTIAALTGIATVGNFRTKDMALGGQGAPLVPFFDLIAFRSRTKHRAVLNIGGIANITLLRRNATERDVAAMDTGPGNMVIDALMQHYYHRGFDVNGSVASRGRIIPSLLRAMLKHPYFARPYPKSTGREIFGEAFVRRILRLAGKARPEDVIATATELTVLSIYDQYNRYLCRRLRGEQLHELVVSGGGSKNHQLMEGLRRVFAPAMVLVSDERGVRSEEKEAVCFALLANNTVCGVPSNIPSVTGARSAAVLGVIAL